MDDAYEEILSLPDGVFRVKYHRLSLKSIRSLRSRWTTELFDLRREISQLNSEIRRKKQAIKIKEGMLNKLTEDNIQKFIEIEQARKKEIQKKANQFLRDTIGEEAYTKLQQDGFFCFTGLDGKTYRIQKNGCLHVDGGNWWYECCYIEPAMLPLPDIIASVFNSVKHSKRFANETRIKRTNEEVTA